MNVFSVLKYVSNHPLNRQDKVGSIFRFCKWQINTRLNPYPIIYQFTDKAKLIVQRGMSGATGNLYCGLHEYEDMAFVLHFLREEDWFVDIGANIGSYTILASGHVGAHTISFEPIPSTYSNLVNNISINQISDKVNALNVALGAATGSIDFTSQFDCVNHVAVEGEKDVIKVPVQTLDGILGERISPVLLKIDVEGFETEVIRGGMKSLSNPDLKAIIIELNGSGARYNYNEEAIHQTLLELGFRTFTYNPRERSLVAMEGHGWHNTIYVRDELFVKRRLGTANMVRVRNRVI